MGPRTHVSIIWGIRGIFATGGRPLAPAIYSLFEQCGHDASRNTQKKPSRLFKSMAAGKER